MAARSYLKIYIHSGGTTAQMQVLLLPSLTRDHNLSLSQLLLEGRIDQEDHKEKAEIVEFKAHIGILRCLSLQVQRRLFLLVRLNYQHVFFSESASVLALTASPLDIVNTVSDNKFLDLGTDSTFESDTEILVSTTKIGLQRSQGCIDTYVPGTLPERFYKQVQLAHETIGGAY
jgi:hypothetical protein